MKFSSSLLFLLFIINFMNSCNFKHINETYIGNFREKSYPFFESLEYKSDTSLVDIINSEKFCCGTKDNYKWLRDTNNLMLTFRILKKIGLNRFISENEYYLKNHELSKDWNGLSLNDIVKRMLASYLDTKDSNNYFIKFWERRKKEQNDRTVYKILVEIDNFYNKKTLNKEQNIDNDTILYQLIKYNIDLNSSDSINRPIVTLKYFNFLKKIELEHSAYNLIFELDISATPSFNKDSLLSTLKYDTINSDQYWHSRNNAKWIKTYLDNGP